MLATPHRLIVDGGTIATLGEPGRVLEGHALVIEGERIAAIVPSAEADRAGAEVVDAAGTLVLPGFINAHMHFYSTLVRGLGKAEPSASFQEVLEHLWWRLDRQLTLEDCYISALVALLQAIRHGTTTLIDHHASPRAVRGSLPAIARAVRECGLRASLCYEVSDRDGEAVAREGIEENAAWIRECAAAGDDQLTALFGLHASFTISDRTLEAAARAGHELGAGFHVHTAEAASDQEACLREHGCRVVERFDRAGLLGEKTVCAHGVHLSERELEILAERRAAIVHNPQSNMNNAVGAASLRRLHAAGVRLALGTDGFTANVVREALAAHLLHSHAEEDPRAGYTIVPRLLFGANAALAAETFGIDLGRIGPGAPADLVLWDYLPPTPLDATNIWGHVMFGLSEARAAEVWVAGRRVLAGGQPVGWDEDNLLARCQAAARRLWQRF